MSLRLLFLPVALALAGPAVAAAPVTATLDGPFPVVRMEPQGSAPAQRLHSAAERLRASITVLAQHPAGAAQQHALAKANEALLETQAAMLALPPRLRSGAAPLASAGYDEGVARLEEAADMLRQSLHAMAQEPPGLRRNQAIAQANRALLDTQAALTQVYDLSLRTAGTAGAAR